MKTIKFTPIRRSFPSFLTIISILIVSTLSAGCAQLVESLAQLQDELDTAIIDPESVRWATYRNMTFTSLSDRNSNLRDDGYMMVDFGFDESTGRYQAIWHENIIHTASDVEREWEAHWDLTSQEFHDYWTQYGEDEYRLLSQETYTKNGSRFFAGIWIENVEELEWKSFRNVELEEFNNRYENYSQQGLMPVDVEVYEINGTMYYASVWVENTDDIDWDLERDLTGTRYGQEFQVKSDTGYRLIALESYMNGNNQNFAAIWIENQDRKPYQGAQTGPDGHGGRAWGALREMSSERYYNRFREMSDRGYRLNRLSVHQINGNTQYAAIWRQNHWRTTWEHRDSADSMVVGFMNDSNLPGISVAIIKDGTFIYRRGFGNRDVQNNLPADSRTIYRLASVSKPIGAVIGYRLEERGLIDLTENTQTYISQLGTQHNHTIEQLLAHQGCMPHYDESTVSQNQSGQFNTAFASAQEFSFWNNEVLQNTTDSEDLRVPAGTSRCVAGQAYRYSTPGYTLVAAAYEQATNKTVNELVIDEIRDPIGFTSFGAEDRTSSNRHRAVGYKANMALANDNISWKVLGGGLEVSAYDLSRFGLALLNNRMISETSRDRMWTVFNSTTHPTRTPGWISGVHEGRSIVRHSGHQAGGNASIRIYPDDNLVLALLSNKTRADSLRSDHVDALARNLATSFNLMD